MNIQKIFEESAPFAIRLIWCTLIIVPTMWILISTTASTGALSGASSVAAAAWAQALGAMLAIGGAAIFPYWHEAEKERRRSDRLRRIVLLLAKNQQEQLRLLHSTLSLAVEDFGEKSINPYVQYEWPMKWPAHLEALRGIPITELDPSQVYMLNELKVGADYAWGVCKRLDDWNILGARERLAVEQLKRYWEMACLTVALLGQGGKIEQ